MFWRTFLYSFLLRSQGNIKSLYRIYTSTNEDITKPAVTNPYLLNQTRNMNQSSLNRSSLNQSSFFGHDNRHGLYRNITYDHMVIMNITQFLEKMKLIHDLENKNLSKNSKLNAIQEYKRIHDPSPLKFNIFGGGLQNDWSDDEPKK
jgi:hypothetical protein